MMCHSLHWNTIWVIVMLPMVITSNLQKNMLDNEALNWAELTASRLVTCGYQNSSGLWNNEEKWQSGTTLETMANFISLTNSSLRYIFHETFMNTDMFVGGSCFDDYQWWLLGWLQAYSVEPDLNYLYRAADIYDFVIVNGWNDTTCRGGVQRCPRDNYKNSITNELFLLSGMRLHPYARLLDRTPTYYLDWALKQWRWFEASGLINGDYLINDGLR